MAGALSPGLSLTRRLCPRTRPASGPIGRIGSLRAAVANSRPSTPSATTAALPHPATRSGVSAAPSAL
eukprot:15475981-Alexandrium_andersonii.AAC.1